MTQKPSDGIGKRLARYRRLAGLSAQQLSDLVGGGISRGVIANIERGAKRDVTVDQLIALAYALDIPPAVLALPVEEPHRMVEMFRGESKMAALESMNALTWFNGFPGFKLNSPPGPGSAVANSMIEGIDSYASALAFESLVGEQDPETVEKVRAERTKVEGTLQSLGVDLTRFKFDE